MAQDGTTGQTRPDQTQRALLPACVPTNAYVWTGRAGAGRSGACSRAAYTCARDDKMASDLGCGATRLCPNREAWEAVVPGEGVVVADGNEGCFVNRVGGESTQGTQQAGTGAQAGRQTGGRHDDGGQPAWFNNKSAG